MNEWVRQMAGLGLSDDVAIFIGVLGLLLFIVVLVLWIFLPFAVFGIKDKLDRANETNANTLTQLVRLNNALSDLRVMGSEPGDITPVRTDLKLCPACHTDNAVERETCFHCGAKFPGKS